MTGAYQIEVRNQRIVFKLSIKRNITVIRGNSATGKTTLVGLIRDYESFGKQSGVSIICSKSCRVLNGEDWMLRLQSIHDSIVFIDEGSRFITTLDFARAVKNSDNYYVLITRENLHNLPYSVDEIYEMHKYRSSQRLSRVYNCTRLFYSDIPSRQSILDTDTIITEDSNSGHEFFSRIAKDHQINCLSAHGKSEIFSVLTSVHKGAVVIADGAAFGSEIDRIYQLMKNMPGKIVLFLPESFEWLILKADIINDPSIADILKAPENYVDSARYFSWEQYFTELLVSRTTDSYKKYTKQKLAPFYLQDGNIKKVMSFIEAD